MSDGFFIVKLFFADFTAGSLSFVWHDEAKARKVQAELDAARVDWVRPDAPRPIEVSPIYLIRDDLGQVAGVDVRKPFTTLYTSSAIQIQFTNLTEIQKLKGQMALEDAVRANEKVASWLALRQRQMRGQGLVAPPPGMDGGWNA